MQIAIALFDGVTLLDALGPHAVLSRVPDAEVVLVAERAGAIVDDTGITVHAQAAFAEITAPDVIVVPGGLITRRLARDGHPVVDWIGRVHPTTTCTTSVCTGALLLGAAGVLQGLEATTHWIALDALASYGATPVERRVVEQRRVITAAGVSAGIDMALTLVARVCGDVVAQSIQLAIEYDPQPPFAAGSPRTAPSHVVRLAAAGMQRAEEALLTG